jgi:hypothetical protein
MTDSIQHVAVPDRLRSLKRHVPKPLKQATRSALRQYGIRTADQRALPDFLVIGVKRGGTTSVWNWLVRHPHIAPLFPAAQQIKSPHYFDIHFARGLDWYRSHFPTRAALARVEQYAGRRPITGEASPYYLFHPQVAARVHEVIPSAKLIVTLRNPVDRAYSNYWERRGSGAEELATFEKAIDAEEARLQGEEERILADPSYYSHHHDCHTYLARGQYVEQLQRWRALFPREQLLVLLFDDLRRDPAAAYRRIQDFLNLPQVDLPHLPHHNKLPVPPMAASTRERLMDFYRPWNMRLREELEIETDWDK